MSLDRYSICPGGTGKKIKFCCSDLLGELQTIEKMLDGEQRLACLEHLEKTLKKYPDRACLLAIKAMLQNELEQDEALRETLDHFQAVHPTNPVALAEQAIMAASTEGGRAGAAALQSALEASENEIPTRLYEAIGYVGEALLSDGELLAAYTHLLLSAVIGGQEDQRTLSLLVSLIRSPRMPVLLKQELVLSDCPEDAPWKKAFDKALRLAAVGAWRAAERAFAELLDEAGQAPEVWHNLAILRSWLADNRQAVSAWQAYATCEGVALEDAVECTAIANLIDPDIKGDGVDVVRSKFPVTDMEPLLGTLSSDARVAQVPVNEGLPLEEGQPPPKAIFWVMDRPMPETGVGLAREGVPAVIGQAFLFGRETDREARVEFISARNDLFQSGLDVLVDVLGDSIDPDREEEIVGQVDRLENAMTFSFRIPPDTPKEHRDHLVRENQRHAILEVWANSPNPTLDDKTPREASADPDLHVDVLAAILLLEWSGIEMRTSFDFNELRREMNLPQLDPIDPQGADVNKLPLLRLVRLKTADLADEQLIDAYRRSVRYVVAHAIRHLTPEVVNRESLDDTVNKAEALGLLARFEKNSDLALGYLEQARNAAEAAEQSPAPWYLAELEVRMARGEQDEFERVLTLLRTQHWNEPGVASAVLQLFRDLGLVGDAGGPMPAGHAATAPPVASEGPAEAAPAESGKIWTPGSDDSPGAAKKSGIWTPDS